MTSYWLSRKPQNIVRPDVVEVKIEREKVQVNRRPDQIRKDRVLKVKRILAVLFLVPLCLFAMLVFQDLFFQGQVQIHLWGSSEFRWFVGGAVLWAAIFSVFRSEFSILYVFGHEWTHIFAARLCRGVVYDYHIGWDGGWVDTNKSNTFISLSPYLLPFYTFFALLIFAAVGVAVKLDAPFPIAKIHWLQDFTLMKGLYFTIGLTWCFHLSYTLRTLQYRQTDVLRNGVWFSRTLIFLVNLMLITFFLTAASPSVGFSQVVSSTRSMSSGIANTYWGGLVAVSNAVNSEAKAMQEDLDKYKKSRQQQPQQ